MHKHVTQCQHVAESLEIVFPEKYNNAYTKIFSVFIEMISLKINQPKAVFATSFSVVVLIKAISASGQEKS